MLKIFVTTTSLMMLAAGNAFAHLPSPAEQRQCLADLKKFLPTSDGLRESDTQSDTVVTVHRLGNESSFLGYYVLVGDKAYQCPLPPPEKWDSLLRVSGHSQRIDFICTLPDGGAVTIAHWFRPTPDASASEGLIIAAIQDADGKFSYLNAAVSRKAKDGLSVPLSARDETSDKPAETLLSVVKNALPSVRTFPLLQGRPNAEQMIRSLRASSAESACSYAAKGR